MARGRMLDKEVCESNSFANLKDSNSQLLCVLLTGWWDDHGKMIGDEAWVKGNIVRLLKQYTIREISRCLGNINNNLDVQWWQDENGRKWLYWSKFDKYQTISKDKKTRDKLPSPKFPKIPQETAGEHPQQDKYKEGSIKKEEEVEGAATAQVIDDFNEVFGTSYKYNNNKNKELINARLKEGFTIEDFKKVHRIMLRVWGADEKMVKYLRPITLWGTKFESYFNMRKPTTELSEQGIKAFLIGRDWLKKHEVANAGQE